MSDNSNSNKFAREFQAYRFRDGYSVAVSKDKVRGKGRALQIHFTSEEGKDFEILGWGIYYSKNTAP